MLQAIQQLRDPLSPRAFEMLGRLALAGALGLGLLIILFAAWKSLTLLLAFLVLLLAIPTGLFLFRHPLLNLATLICSFVLIAGYDDGIQITEVLFGLYYLAFQTHWFVTRVFLQKERIFERREARILAVFLVLASLSGALTIMFGGSLRMLMGEWLSLSLLSLYFPVREAATRYRFGPHVILGALVAVGLFVLARNILNYQAILIEATYAWQVTKGRAVTNESLMMIPSFFALTFLLHARSKGRWLAYAAAFGVFFGGLILTQSRGYWLAFFGGALVMLAVLGRRERIQLVGVGILSLLTLLLAGYAILGDYFILILSGIIDRVLSIGSAATSDISLVNRIRETLVVWGLVLKNPILGYGMGVPFRFYDLTYLPPFTHVTTFLHNGYLALWYKFGIWGLGMALFAWGAALRRGLEAFRTRDGRLFLRLVGLSSSVGLSAFAVSSMTSNPWYVNDTMMLFGVLMGLATGVLHRIRLESKGFVDARASVA